MNCNQCLKVNPLPSCIDSDVFELWGLTFPDYPSQTIVVRFKDTSNGRITYFEIETDPDGAIIDFDVASLFPLSDHVYEIRFTTLSSGSPANFTLTNEDDSTASGCCIEFTVDMGLTVTGGFFLSNLGCAADEPTGGNNSLYMLKADYDPDGSGCVECAEEAQAVGGYSIDDILELFNSIPQSAIVDLVSDLLLKENKSEKGQALGYVPLNGAQKIDDIYLNFTSPLDPVIAWNPVTNDPSISDAGGSAGEIYIVYDSANPTARDLGSGSINWNDGDAAIFDSGTNTFKKIGGFVAGVIQITTASGVFTGAVTLNSTAHFNNSTNKNFVDDDMLAGIVASPNPVTALNPVATQADLTGIVVGSGFFMAENFSNGETLGNGIHRTLQSLGYSDAEAALAWPYVNSNHTIDVTVMDIDWISIRESFLTMQNEQYSAFITPGGRGYMPYDTILLPREQNVWSGNRRGLMFDFDFKGSAFRNTTGNSFICFDRYPVDQTEANSNFLDFKYNMKNAFWVGNDTDDENDCFIRIGASVGSYFESIKGENTGIVIDAQFCLQVGFKDIYTVAHGKYGIACRDGLWSGAGANISQSNNATFDKCHISNGSGKAAEAGIYCQGNRNIKIDTCQFEGQNGAVRQIFYEQNTPGSPTLDVLTVKNTIEMTNLDFEAAGASRAGIHVLGNNISAFLEKYQTQVSATLPPDMPVLYEAECFNNTNGRITSFIRYSNNSNPGYKFRNNNFGSTQAWVIEYVELNNPAVLNSANWDTVGGTIPSAVNFTPII